MNHTRIRWLWLPVLLLALLFIQMLRLASPFESIISPHPVLARETQNFFIDERGMVRQNLPEPQPAPTGTGTLIGLITNAETGERLSGVVVSTNGQTVQTGSNGLYLFDNLSPGLYVVRAEDLDFYPASRSRSVVSNQTRWNSITLTPREQPKPTETPTGSPAPTDTATAPASPTATATTLPPSPTATAVAPVSPAPSATIPPLPSATPTGTPDTRTGTLIGLITDAATGERLSGVTVSVAGQINMTDEHGVYRFEAVPNGMQIVRAEKDGYQPGAKSRAVIPDEVRWNSIKLTKNFSGCPTRSNVAFDLIPVGQTTANTHPDYLHGDLNLAQRGYAPTQAALSLRDYDGGVDLNAPQLAGLFEPNYFPGISAVYRVNHWDWSCAEHGCRGAVITDWPVTLLGLPATPGQAIYIPERSPQVYAGGFKAVVLYAEEKRITLGYTRLNTIAFGYAVHLENVCIDPNLLALYRAQNDAAGFRLTGYLPALRNNEKLGVAFSSEIRVAIRDRGAFMDPRSRKDWWRGY